MKQEPAGKPDTKATLSLLSEKVHAVFPPMYVDAAALAHGLAKDNQLPADMDSIFPDMQACEGFLQMQAKNVADLLEAFVSAKCLLPYFFVSRRLMKADGKVLGYHHRHRLRLLQRCAGLASQGVA